MKNRYCQNQKRWDSWNRREISCFFKNFLIIFENKFLDAAKNNKAATKTKEWDTKTNPKRAIAWWWTAQICYHETRHKESFKITVCIAIGRPRTRTSFGTIFETMIRTKFMDEEIKNIGLDLNAQNKNDPWQTARDWVRSRSIYPQKHQALGSILKALSTTKVSISLGLIWSFGVNTDRMNSLGFEFEGFFE